MRTLRAITAILALCAALCGCSDSELFPAFVADSSVRMEIGGSSQFSYDESACTLWFNRERGEFCAGTDNMSDYFKVKLGGVPVMEGEEFRASLEWTTPTSTRKMQNVALEAVKVEGDRIWLWNDENRIALVVRVLD